MKVDKEFCNSSYLTYRYIVDSEFSFDKKIVPKVFSEYPRISVYNTEDTLHLLKKTIDKLFINEQQVALMLSGGIDSAILAALVPKGTKAFTFKPDAPGALNEVEFAKKYADINQLDHEVIEVSWQDYDNVMDKLMLRKGAPIHSIEPQIFIAAQFAKKQGYSTLLFGEAADAVFGGLSGLLSKDMNLEEFYKRFSFVDPREVLKDPLKIIQPIIPFVKEDGTVDVHKFLNNIFFKESYGSYENACELAEINFISPYNQMILESNLDIERIRAGENKYILREIFSKLYPDLENRKKIPMPRAVDQWFENWDGPNRKEFLQQIDIGSLSGDQKWMVYCLERFLNLIDKKVS